MGRIGAGRRHVSENDGQSAVANHDRGNRRQAPHQARPNRNLSTKCRRAAGGLFCRMRLALRANLDAFRHPVAW